MPSKFDTKVGPLRYNVREIIHSGGQSYWSSLGYKDTLRDAKELATQDPSRHTQVVDADGRERFEHTPEDAVCE